MANAGDDIRLYVDRESPGDRARRAFTEFLALPTAIMLGFVLFGLGMYALERSDLIGFSALQRYLRGHIFGAAAATSNLLATIASSIITVTSITLSLLLLVVQQSAAALSQQIVDQFLRRRLNQVYFGCFIGLALYTLIMLATVNPPYNPVLGATLALLLTMVALGLLLFLIYNTIHQMRSVVIVETVHDHIMLARRRQLALIDRTRRCEEFAGPIRLPLTTMKRGYVARVNLASLEGPLANARGAVEIVLSLPIGAYAVFGDTIAMIKAEAVEDARALREATQGAIVIERERDLANDPAYGIEQLLTMAWTSASTSKQNPAPGLQVLYSLRDVLARCCTVTREPPDQQPLPVVYHDNVPVTLLGAFESLAVVASESMQQQIYAEVAHAVATMLVRLIPDQQERTQEVILRILPALGDLVLTAELDAALTRLSEALAAAGRITTAVAVATAQAELRKSVGKLNSRATRVPTAG
jgi:uncharacterized membrane protein